MSPFIIHLTYLAAVMFIIGVIGTLALYRFKFDEFAQSGLALKIIVWIPLWVIYILGAYFLFNIFISLIIGFSLIETFWENRRAHFSPRLFYSVLFIVGIGLFAVFVEQSPNPAVMALSLLAACALSDITAFFVGHLFGYHSLPKSINQKKSWEGVFGQLLGGAVGMERIRTLGAVGVSIGIALSVGFGSALGDMVNSFFKRATNVTRWSNYIPGHGGVGDRFASIAGTGYFLMLVKIILH